MNLPWTFHKHAEDDAFVFIFIFSFCLFCFYFFVLFLFVFLCGYFLHSTSLTFARRDQDDKHVFIVLWVAVHVIGAIIYAYNIIYAYIVAIYAYCCYIRVYIHVNTLNEIFGIYAYIYALLYVYIYALLYLYITLHK